MPTEEVDKLPDKVDVNLIWSNLIDQNLQPWYKLYITSIKSSYRKLEKEVGIAMPKSIQTRVVGMTTNTTGIPTLHTLAHWHHTTQPCPLWSYCE